MKMAIRFFMNRNNVRSISIFYTEVVRILRFVLYNKMAPGAKRKNILQMA